MKKIKKRATFEINLIYKTLTFYYNYKFNYYNYKIKIFSNRNVPIFTKIISKLLFIHFLINLNKNVNRKINKILLLFYPHKLKIFGLLSCQLHVYIFLKINFIHFLKFKLQTLFDKKKKNYRLKNNDFVNINQIKIKFSIKKDWVFNSNHIKKKELFYLLNSFNFKIISGMLFLRKIFFDMNLEINPDYFQILFSFVSFQQFLNSTNNNSVYSINLIFFIIKEIVILCSNNYFLIKKRNKKIIFSSTFFIYLIVYFNFLEFIFQKITKNSYLFYQNFQLIIKIFKYIENFSIFFTRKIKNVIKMIKATYNLYKLKNYVYNLFLIIFQKKFVFLRFSFYEKFLRDLCTDRVLTIKLFDKFSLKIIKILESYKLTTVFFFNNEFNYLFLKIIYKPDCIFLNLFFIIQLFKLLKHEKNILNKKLHIILYEVFYRILISIDQFISSSYFIKLFLFTFIKIKNYLFYFKNDKSKEEWKILIKSRHFFNFKIFNLLENKVRNLRLSNGFHNFIEKKKITKKFYVNKTIKLWIKIIFTIYICKIKRRIDFNANYNVQFILEKKNYIQT